jgi:thiol-disulfide isomerase/thioredoxin
MKTAAKPTFTLLKFTARWCPPCKEMERSRLLEAFVERHPEVELEKVDIDRDGARADAYAIRAVPTLVILGADGEELARGHPATAAGVERLFTLARSRA